MYFLSQNILKFNYFLTVFCVVLFGIFWVTRTISASHIIHSNLLHSILRCPISFFDTTPSGRIINRFSQDLSAVDTKIPFYIEMALYSGTVLLGTLAAITYAAQWFLLVAIPLGLVYFVLMVKVSLHNTIFII